MAKYKVMQLNDGMYYVTNSTGTKHWAKTGNVDKAIVEQVALTRNAQHKLDEFIKAHKAVVAAGASVNYHAGIVTRLCGAGFY